MSSSKKPFVVNIALLTLFTVVAWVVYSTYAVISKPVDVIVPTEKLDPLDPTLDADTLTKLQQSIYLSENELVESVSIVSVPEEPESEEEIPANEGEQP